MGDKLDACELLMLAHFELLDWLDEETHRRLISLLAGAPLLSRHERMEQRLAVTYG